ACVGGVGDAALWSLRSHIGASENLIDLMLVAFARTPQAKPLAACGASADTLSEISSFRVKLTDKRPPELLFVLDEGLGLLRLHDLDRHRQLGEPLPDAWHRQRFIEGLVQSAQYVGRRSPRSGETHEADGGQARNALGDRRHVGIFGITLL